MKKTLGIDIGGSSIKAGLFSCEGKLEGIARMATGTLTDAKSFARVVNELMRLLDMGNAAPADVVGIGLDVPGPVDEAGTVGMLPNISLDAEGLKCALSRAFPQAKLAFVNDVNAAALGELWQGAAKGASDFVLVALGTGVGSGVVVDGKLVPGAFGTAGEIGHLTVNKNEKLTCGCGRRGCLEQYASASGVVRSYRQACEQRGIAPVHLDGPTDTLAVFAAHRAGDTAARDAVSLMCDTLGFALAQVSTIVDPPLYLIGGGMGEGFDLFADELRKAFHTYCLPANANARITPAALGNEAAMYGSAYLASPALLS